MTQSPQGNPAPQPGRDSQTAVAPLNTLDVKDVGAGAAKFDRWLRKISDNYVTLERLTTVAGSLPVLGNIMALIDTVMDVVSVVDKYAAGKPVDPLDWVTLGVNLVGVIPAPGTSAARMTLRPGLHLVKQKMRTQAGRLGDALIEVLVTHMSDQLAGDLETFAEEAQTRLDGILKDCADFADTLVDDLILILKRCIGKEPLFKLAKAPPAETRVYDPEAQSRVNRMLAWLSREAQAVEHATGQAVRQGANLAASYTASHLPNAAVGTVTQAIGGLTRFKGDFRGRLVGLADAKVDQSIGFLLQALLTAARRKTAARRAVIPANQGVKVDKTIPGHTNGALGSQAPAKEDANACKSCPAPTKKGGAISLATGCESFTHTDFVLGAPLPIDWSRTYRSNLAAYDQGSLGARWSTPFSTRVDVLGHGRTTALLYHGVDGRSHRYPWLEIGQTHRDAIEEVTLTRMSETLLTLDFGKVMPEGAASPWRESYELVNTVPSKTGTQGHRHFRLVAQHASSGAAIGLRYDHLIEHGPHAGEYVLSDIISKQGDEVIAHVGTQPDAATGWIAALWELRDGEVIRQLAAYTYDEHGDLVAAQDENAASWQYTYRDHLVTRYTDRTGRGTNLAYDGTGPAAKAVREWADDGSFDTRLEWDKNIRLTYLTDALGSETWYYYDILGYTYRVVHPNQREEWFYRDDAKNVTRHIHPDGSTDDYRYDEDGNLQSHVRADGSQVHFEYDTQHRLTGVRDAAGGVWKRDYDPQGNLTEETDPRGLVTAYVYDKAGRPVEITDAKGGVKKLAYTPTGQLASYTDCSGKETRWDYDARDRLLKSIDAAGHATRYRYTAISAETLTQAADGLGNFPGQLEAVTLPDDTEERLQHDAEGRLLAHTDAMQRSTRYRYTPAGQIGERIDALGQRLGYEWDALGRLKVLRNENGRPYEFRYDPVGKLLSERGFDDKLTEYTYDENSGVLLWVTDGGVITRLEFDQMDRLLERRAAATGQPEQVESFGYDANGRLVQADNEHAKLQWFHDAAGNPVREHHHYLATKQTAVWEHHYDELNTRVGTIRPGGHSVEWLTYGAGHVHGLMLDGQEMFGFERDDLHREVIRVQGNGLAQRQQYDPVGRLLEQQVSSVAMAMPSAQMGIGAFKYQPTDRTALGKPAAILRQYHYDKAGQLTSIGDSRRGQIDYRYDPVGRLLQATSALAAERFAFDPASNMIEPGKDESAPSPTTGIRVLDNLLREYSGTHYRYDERGNLVERVHNGKRSEFAWDAFGRMTQAITPEGGAIFAYDALGRRIAKHGEARGTSTHTLFGWDGDTLAFESATTRGNASTPSTAHTVHYVHEKESFVPLAQARQRGTIALKPTTDVRTLTDANGGTYDIELDPLWRDDDVEVQSFAPDEVAFYQCDHLGTPQELTDHEGNVAWSAQYKAWGLAEEAIGNAAHSAGFTNPIRFQGQYTDVETGLHYNRHRYYDPISGRFLSKDPIGLFGGVNLHQFAPNPVEWIDPLGLTPKPPSKVALPDAHGASASDVAASKVGGGSRASQQACRQKLLQAAKVKNGGAYKCWRCGQTSTNPDDMHLGHKNVPTSKGGNLADVNVDLEGASCNLSAGNSGYVKDGSSCVERGSCGAPYGR